MEVNECMNWDGCWQGEELGSGEKDGEGFVGLFGSLIEGTWLG